MTDDFVPWMRLQMRMLLPRVVRIHVAGDFYDDWYVRKWIDIVRTATEVMYFTYTRSWRDDSMLPELIRLGKLPNMALWWSMDRETGPAPLIFGIRRVYMAVDDRDAAVAPDDCDLVFRVRRSTPMKKANGVLVCPAENGVTGKFRHTCTTCKLCWTKVRRSRWEEALSDILQREITTPDVE